MESPELAQTRLILLAAGVAIVVCWLLARASGRRRLARFEEIARGWGTTATRENEFLLRFEAEVSGRAVEVRYQHIGGSSVSGWTPDWYLVTVIPLRGVRDVHSVEIRPRSSRARRGEASPGSTLEFERDFEIRDQGYPLTQGWATEPTRDAIYAFHSQGLPLELLSIEEARLVHRTRTPLSRFEGEGLRLLLTRQAAVADALERAL